MINIQRCLVSLTIPLFLMIISRKNNKNKNFMFLIPYFDYCDKHGTYIELALEVIFGLFAVKQINLMFF